MGVTALDLSRLKTVVRGREGMLACKIVLLHQILFMPYDGCHKTVTKLRQILPHSVFVDTTIIKSSMVFV